MRLNDFSWSPYASRQLIFVHHGQCRSLCKHLSTNEAWDLRKLLEMSWPLNQFAIMVTDSLNVTSSWHSTPWCCRWATTFFRCSSPHCCSGGQRWCESWASGRWAWRRQRPVEDEIVVTCHFNVVNKSGQWSPRNGNDPGYNDSSLFSFASHFCRSCQVCCLVSVCSCAHHH